MKIFSPNKDDYALGKYSVFATDILNEICTAEKNNDYNMLVLLLKFILSKDKITLRHPFLPEVITTARSSYRTGSSNFIFFSDLENDNPWILIQNTDFINAIVTPEYIYNPFEEYESVHFKSSIKALFDFIGDVGDLGKYFDGDGFLRGVAIGKPRPYHCIYDTFKNLVHLEEELKDKSILIEKGRTFYFDPLWISNKFKKNQNKKINDIYLFPNILGQYRANALNSKAAKKTMLAMEGLVKKNAPAYSKINVSSYYSSTSSLKIWFGITGQKRAWLSQIESCISICNELLSKYSEIDLYIDGMTSPVGKIKDNPEDQMVFNDLKSKLPSKVNVYNLISLNYADKILLCNQCDIFVANAGSGSIVPLRIAKKPGVLHSNKKLYAFPDHYGDNVYKIKDSELLSVEEDQQVVMNQSYDCSYNVVYQKLVSILS